MRESVADVELEAASMTPGPAPQLAALEMADRYVITEL